MGFRPPRVVGEGEGSSEEELPPSAMIAGEGTLPCSAKREKGLCPVSAKQKTRKEERKTGREERKEERENKERKEIRRKGKEMRKRKNKIKGEY